MDTKKIVIPRNQPILWSTTPNNLHIIFDFERIKSPQLLIDLLRLIAFQIGNEIPVNKLSKT